MPGRQAATIARMVQEGPQRAPFDGPVPWDEYRWEAYIRRQDARADEYAALVDYYGDQPDAHNLIARLMGWTHLLTNCQGEPSPRQCTACPHGIRSTCRFHQAYFGAEYAANLAAALESEHLEEQTAETEWDVRYGRHPVHALTERLVAQLHALCESLPPGALSGEEPLRRLLHLGQRCVTRVSAALNEYTPAPMLGLAIAYLKMAHQSACAALGQIHPCVLRETLDAPMAEELARLLLGLRGRIHDLIEDFRARLLAAREQRGA